MAISTWDDICASVDAFAKKVSKKTDQLAADAAVRIKISSLKVELEEAYTKLGQMTYENTYAIPVDQDVTAASEAEEQIKACALSITSLRDQIAALEAEIAK